MSTFGKIPKKSQKTPDDLLSTVIPLLVNILHGMTKLFIRKYAEILSTKRPALKVYSCCPGWCKTDMAGWEKPPLTAEQGADNACTS